MASFQKDTGQEADAGSADGLTSLTIGSGVLRSVFCDLLGRPPFQSERDEWLGRPLSALVDETLDSESFWNAWWEQQLYYFLLVDSFRPETERIRNAPSDLAAGKLDVRGALHRVALTPTFDLRNPGADTFVTVAMEQFCGLSVDREKADLEAGKRAYDGLPARFLGKAASNQSDVIRICVEDRKAAAHLLEREYQRLLRQEPSRREISSDVRSLHKDARAFTKILRAWLLSDAYALRLSKGYPKSNSVFVRGLFIDLHDRFPDKEELESMRSALDGLADPGALRAVLTRMLMNASQEELPTKKSIPDPTKWVRTQFQRLLGREPEAAELAGFVSIYHQPACTPRTILYALLTHPEYQKA